MKNKLVHLRDHLFETIEMLKDKDSPMDIQRALAVAEVSKQVIAAAKVEVDFLRKTDGSVGTGFFEPATSLPAPKARLITHRT